jgi:hypothetical protein
MIQGNARNSRTPDSFNATYRDEMVLIELRTISAMPIFTVTDGWVRAFHVRFFRGDATPAAIRVLTLDQINYTLRKLSRGGLLVRRGRRAEYREAR